MIWFILFLVLILCLILSIKGHALICDDCEETTVTITTDSQHLNIVGNLKRQIEGEQAFVIDPVDQKRIWLNSNDDMYEDADGKIWRLV